MTRLAAPLAERTMQTAERELAAARRRTALRAWVAVAATLRRAFPGVAPAACRALRLGEEAAAELAAILDTPALCAADAALLDAEPGREEAAAEFAARLARLAARCDGEAFDPDRAAPAELLVRAALRGARSRGVL